MESTDVIFGDDKYPGLKIDKENEKLRFENLSDQVYSDEEEPEQNEQQSVEFDEYNSINREQNSSLGNTYEVEVYNTGGENNGFAGHANNQNNEGTSNQTICHIRKWDKRNSIRNIIRNPTAGV